MSAAQTLAEQNDAFRNHPFFSGLAGRIILTEQISSTTDNDMRRIAKAIMTFDKFCEENDPYGEHDFGSIDLEGLERIFWKIDYYADSKCEMGSEDPSNPRKCYRVLTVMFANEY